MFTETVNHARGTAEGTASEAHAVQLLRRAARRGHTVTARPDGGAVITWTAARLLDGEVVEDPRSVTLAPQTPVRLTPTDLRHLDLISRAPAALPVRADGFLVIDADADRIPAPATARLYGLRLVVEERGRIRLTLVAVLALLAARQASPEAVAAAFRAPATPQPA